METTGRQWARRLVSIRQGAMADELQQPEERGGQSRVLPYRTPDADGSSSVYVAIAALVCALLFVVTFVASCAGGPQVLWVLLPVFALAAILLGTTARRNARGPDSGRGFATTAVWLGSVETCLLIVAMFVLPQMGAPGERAFRSKCGSNLRNVGYGIMLYANDHQGVLPPTLDALVASVEIDLGSFICPSSSHDTAPGATAEERIKNFHSTSDHCSFIYLGKGLTAESLKPKYILAHDRLGNHENGGMNVLYGDGETEWLPKEEADRVVMEISEGFNPPRQKASPSKAVPTRPAAPPPTTDPPPP
jgi:hypothetical protein